MIHCDKSLREKLSPLTKQVNGIVVAANEVDDNVTHLCLKQGISLDTIALCDRRSFPAS